MARLVHSHGFIEACDVKSPSTCPYARRDFLPAPWEELKPGTTVYIHGSAMIVFIRQALHKIKNPVVIVSGDCDSATPDIFPTEYDYKVFIERPTVAAWFAQNLTVSHPKAHFLPIGLDYHMQARHAANPFGPQMTADAQEELLLGIARSAPSWKDRKVVAYANFQLRSDRYKERAAALSKSAKDAVRVEQFIPRAETWRRQSECAFVLSPFGCGVDCHRTWEALALGCVPIIKTSPLDRMYDGLPVLIIEDWAQVTRQFLDRAHASPPKMTAPEKMTLGYWVSQFHGVIDGRDASDGARLHQAAAA